MANFTLELVFPRAPGAAGTGFSAGHKLYFAYPGITYRYFAGAVGGVPPFVFSVSGQPSGMVIDSDTGEVTWPNPIVGTYTGITVMVEDQESTSDSATYTLEVTTTGFVFIDAAAADDTGAGTIGDPWKSIDRLYDDTNDVFAYFYTGTYVLTDVPVTVGADPDQPTCEFFQGAGRCTTWLAVPGETVVVDHESNHIEGASGRKPAIRLSGDHIYVDGIEFLNAYHKCLWTNRTNRYGHTIINCRFVRLGPGAESRNCAAVMYNSLVTFTSFFDLVVNCYVEEIGMGDDAVSFLKFYTTEKSYTAFNAGSLDLESSEVIAYKVIAQQFMNYRNDIVALTRAARGNMGGGSGLVTSGEWWFNRYQGGEWSSGEHFAMAFNQDGLAGPMYWERNTIQGSLVAESVGTGDGPFVFRHNVIINEDVSSSPIPYVIDLSVTAPELIDCVTSATPTGTQNLAGNAAAALVNATTGLLEGAARTAYLGSWGHEIVADAPLVTSGPPARLVAAVF